MENSSRGGNPAQSGSDAFLANYRMGKVLGIGSFGKVRVAEHTATGYKVAIKVLSKKKIRMTDMEEKGWALLFVFILEMGLHLYKTLDNNLESLCQNSAARDKDT
jgi:5'-AMP-activated protein kinase catalytic alpha subunit